MTKFEMDYSHRSSSSNKENLTVQQLKQIQLNILLEVAAFCDKNNIKYFLTAGTLIGALRHKGFIPWDDDIDLVMLRPDYERFIAEFNTRPMANTFKVVSPQNNNYPYAYAKVMDTSTVFIENSALFKQFPMGVNIDLFPLDFLTDNYASAQTLLRQVYRYNRLLGIKSISLDKQRSWYKQTCLILLKGILKPFTINWLTQRINKLAQKYVSQTTSKYVGQIVLEAKGEREIVERAWFDSCVPVPFEGHSFAAPVGYDQYLKRLFGDYMQLPPKEKQISHHYFKAYYKGEKL